MNQDFHAEAGHKFFDSNVCVEKIIWLAGQQGHQSDDWDDLIEYDADDAGKALDHDICDGDTPECVIADLAGEKDGFLVQLSAPIPEKVYDDGGFDFSCSRRLRWIYVESLEGIPDVAVAFAAEVVERVRKEQSVNQ